MLADVRDCRFSARLPITYRVEAEKFRGAVISRVYFKGEPETSHFVEGDIFVQRLNDSSCLDRQPHSCLANDLQSCVSLTVYIKVNNRFIQAGPIKSKLLVVC